MKQLLLCLGLSLAALAAQAQDDPASGPERARIASERGQADKLLSAQEAGCYRKFAVTDCLKAARAQRREKLSDLRRQELTLNDAQRKRRAGERVLGTDERNSAQQQEDAAAQRSESAARRREKTEAVEQRVADRAQAPGSAPARAARTPRQAPERRGSSRAAKAQKPHDTAGELRLSQERQLQAQERRERVANRLAEPHSPQVKPLPVPP